MATNLKAALKQDYSDYRKKLSALEKEKRTIERKIESLNKEYSMVLELMKTKTKKVKKSSKRVKRGQAKPMILDVLKKSKKPMRAFEVVNAVSGRMSPASVRQLLPKMVASKEIVKDKNKAYSLKTATKTKLRKNK